MGSVKEWAEYFDNVKEQERIEKELEEERTFVEEHSKVTVGLRMDAYDAELLKMFAKKYDESISSVGSQLLSISIREAIEGIGGDPSEWLLTASKNLSSKNKG